MTASAAFVDTDVAIIGAGAAGLMCAIECGKRGRRTVILEHNSQIGRKILISGGGRCNFTNLHTRPENFLSANSHFAKSALSRYSPRDFIALVERHRIRYHEKKLGQLFCDGSAAEIVNMLQAECLAAGAWIETSRAARNVTHEAECFLIESEAASWRAKSLVIASGGLSISKIGATGFGYDIARQFGLSVIPPRPALVPLQFGKDDLGRFGSLSGISTEVTARAGPASFGEKMLFTHQGLSGPAILQASSYWSPGESLEIDLLPGFDAAAEMRAARAEGSRVEFRGWLGGHLPKNLTARWAEIYSSRHPGLEKPAAMWSDREIDIAADALHRWRIVPSGTAGFEKAEVTAGGVDTNELSSKTFEARKVPGLYFIGEAVDVTGHLGGFNFQWAWASGYSAGQFA